jgi:hypothetical protein
MLQAGNQSTQAVNTALEAACCCMQVLSAASMHNSLYIDELMTAVVSLAKYHLQYNVLALHDPQYKRLYRPAAAAAPGEAEGKAWFWAWSLLTHTTNCLCCLPLYMQAACHMLHPDGFHLFFVLRRCCAY